MTTIIIYVMLCAYNPEDLTAKAAKLTAEGFRPQGGVSIDLPEMCQAFVKEKKKP